MIAFYFICALVWGLIFLGILLSGLGLFNKPYSAATLAKFVLAGVISGLFFALSLSLLIQEESQQLDTEAQDCLDRGGLVVRRGTGTYIGCAEKN